MAEKGLYTYQSGQWVSLTNGAQPNDGFVLGTTRPTASNTGVQDGITLSPHSGDFVFSSDGQVCQNLDISGRVIFGNYSNTVLRNCIIRGGPAPTYGTSHILANFTTTTGANPSNRLMEFCEIAPSDPSIDIYGTHGNNFTISRCHIHDCVDLVNQDAEKPWALNAEANVNVLGCYLERSLWYANDPRQVGNSDPNTHNDLIQLAGGANIVIRGNMLDATQKSGMAMRGGFCIVMTQVVGRYNNLLVDSNWCYGSKSSHFTGHKSGANGGNSVFENTRFTNNVHGEHATIDGRGDTGNGEVIIMTSQDLFDAIDFTGSYMERTGLPPKKLVYP